METVIKFVLSLVLQAALYSMVVMIFSAIIQDGLAGMTLSRVGAMFERVATAFKDALYKALIMPVKILFQVLRQILQIPITLAWQNVPGVSDVADEPKIGSLLPGLSKH